MTMVVENPLEEPMISKLFIGGAKELEQYRQELLDGILDFEIEKGKWTYTYHDRIVNYPLFNQKQTSLNQIDFVINELKRNPSSRRAVMLIRNPSIDAYSDDPACLQHIQYFIRDNKLHCKVLFRSNDACKATFMNAFGLIMLQKRIADALNVEMGTYTHRASSFHCYEKDLPMLDGYCRSIAEKDIEDCTYEYVGDWDELMEEYQEEIEASVAELKTH
jgi:thymidylate synthase